MVGSYGVDESAGKSVAKGLPVRGCLHCGVAFHPAAEALVVFVAEPEVVA